MQSKIHSDTNYSEFTKTTKSPPQIFMFWDTNKLEIEKIIQNMESKNSRGHDGLSMKTLKLIGKTVSEPLSCIFNLMLLKGEFPDALKLAKIVPLFKSGSKHDKTNYKPISLLPTISKVFEKLLYRRL